MRPTAGHKPCSRHVPIRLTKFEVGRQSFHEVDRERQRRQRAAVPGDYQLRLQQSRNDMEIRYVKLPVTNDVCHQTFIVLLALMENRFVCKITRKDCIPCIVACARYHPVLRMNFTILFAETRIADMPNSVI